MTTEQRDKYDNPPCIERPGFLWFKSNRHEPGESIGLGVIHVEIGGASTREPTIEHLVAVECVHCGQTYLTTYHWHGSISWSVWDEHSLEWAWDKIREREANRVRWLAPVPSEEGAQDGE